VRSPKSYARREPKREPYESVLIVCEGGKTERYYLSRLQQVYRLSSANIRITPADGTDPLTVVAFAEREFARDEYDRAVCVFDRDEHKNYAAALQRIAKLPKFWAITSWPCFEIWVLLHFVYSAAPHDPASALLEVRKRYAGYTKGGKTTFDDLAPMLDNAIRHAERLVKDNLKTGAENPATRMHELVTYLIGLKR
jgi:hypothetical protein